MFKKIITILTKNYKVLFYSCMLCCMLTTPACSIYMASKKQGSSIDEMVQCKTRTCLIHKGATVVSQKTNKQDILTEEVFIAQHPSGSSGRAAMHGVLDVATLGLWEVAGTTMEGVLDQPDKYGFKVIYMPDGEQIKSLQLAH